MAREFGRSARVSSQIQKELAVLLQREFGARLGFITVNEVEISKDLAFAKIYFTVLNTDEAGKLASVKYLNDAAPYIRSELGKRMRLRNVPGVRFYYDDSFDAGMRVAALLKDVKTDDHEE
ncbi:MAG: ribosome-binding factor A [Gammaproteobacteria bacterium HGW-Gammaproteobacteria-3]|nr:MAG: ribosome-binding factor A [Gammaproteobacteria bacterium HGW-Gammaproteobacteria-3]